MKNLLFSAWPYIAVSLLVIGIVVRYLMERKQMDVVRQEMSEAWAMFGGARIWKIAVLSLALAHAALLLLPRAVLSWNGNRSRLYLFEMLLFAAAIAAVIGLARVVWHHLRHSNRSAIAELSDSVFLGLLLVGTLSGTLLAVFYRWGSSWGAMVLAPYVASLGRLNPDAAFAAQMPFLVRLHVFSAFAALAVLPLTRLAAVLVFVLHGALGLLGRPVSAAGRAAEAWLRRHNPAARLWPEED
jgi:nitrate reductase gamma subunit